MQKLWEVRQVPDSYERMFTYETLLTASWTPDNGVVVTSSVLPQTWDRALARIGRDLKVRQFNGAIAHIQFEAEHRVYRDADEEDYIWLSSAVTPVGDVSHGMMHNGDGVLADADEESIAQHCVYFIQDQIERSGIVWPRGRVNGIVGAALVDGVATWRDDERVAIGKLQP